MTSCVLSLFFLVSLCSCVDPTGLKVRITDRSINVLKDVGLEYLKEFLNKPQDFPVGGRVNCQVKGWRFTSLSVEPQNFHITFQQNAGLQFQIKNMIFTAEFERDINLCIWRQLNFRLDSRTAVLAGTGLSATIDVKLKRNGQGRLNVEIPECKFNAENIMIKSAGKIGGLWDLFRSTLQSTINSEACGLIKTNGATKINDMLNGLSMEKLQEDLNINMDYSLSGDIAVTSNSLDIPFKGLVFSGTNRNNDLTGKDPVITESDKMAFVAVSDVFFKSAAQAIFNAGPFQKDVQDISKIIKDFLSLVGIPTGLVEVELTEVPTVTISTTGVSIQAKGTVRSVAKPEKVFPLECKIDVNVEIQGDRLILLSKNSRCNVQPQKPVGKLLKPVLKSGVQSKIKDFIKSWFDGGVPIPLPKGVNFNGRVKYHDGFVVVGGDLSFDPSGVQAMVKKLKGEGTRQTSEVFQI